MEVTAGDVLVQVQRLLGEPAGSYYDMRYRLQQLNMAQAEMVQDAAGSVATVEIEVVGEDIYLPDDYATLAKENPYFRDERGNVSPIEIVPPSYMDAYVPNWQDGRDSTSPRFLIFDGSRRVRLWPKVIRGTLVFPYTNRPGRLWDEDDEIFDGDPTLARYGTGLAYKVAASEVMGINPELGSRYLSLYRQEVGRMRDARRTSPGRHQKVRGGLKVRRTR